MLVGRANELAELDRLVSAVRGGRAAVLRLVGEPGIGKTTLLDEAAARARGQGLAVVQVAAVEVEAGIPGAVVGLVEAALESANPAGAAKSGVIGSGGGASPAALLSALAAAAGERGLLITVDDVQWLDDSSLLALSFAARRLLADPVGLLFAGRPESDLMPALAPFTRVEVPPLSLDEGLALLRAVTPPVAEGPGRAAVRSLGGVPLALVEAGALLSPEALAGQRSLPSPLPVGPAVQERYARGLAELAPETRLALAILAADDSSEAGAVAQALAAASLRAAALEPAEAAGLVRLGSEPAFVHPLVRAAVHAASGGEQRRRAHTALSAVHAARGDRARALRHRALAATGPDEQIAAELEAEALARERQDAHAAAAAAAELAAELSVEPGPRLRRLTLAAELTPDVGHAQQLVDSVLASAADPELRARAVLVQANDTLGFAPHELDAALASIEGASLSGGTATRLAVARVWSAMESADVQRLEALATKAGENAAEDWILTATLGMAFTYLGRHEAGVALLRQATEVTSALDPERVPMADLWTWAILPGWLGEEPRRHRERVGAMARRYRATGRPALAASAAFFSAERARRDGLWSRAEALFAEAAELSRALQQPAALEEVRLASVTAYRGESERTRELLASAERGFDQVMSRNWNHYWVDQSRGALALTLGRLDEAIPCFERVRAAPHVGRGCRDAVACALVDQVEALVGSGDLVGARRAADELGRRLAGIVDPHGLALIERCQALSRPEEAEGRYRSALALHARADDPFEHGRTQLHFGEHLRRGRRPRDAREPLRAALAAFDRVGAGPWAARASRELAASGDRTPSEVPRPSAELTPQELRVALAVAEGMTNAEAATALFLSVKTVEFHLGRVYRKLGVRSRGGLTKALAAHGLLS